MERARSFLESLFRCMYLKLYKDYGSHPFSTPEATAISTYLTTQNALAYIDFHAFSQLWMFPFGYDCNKKADTFDQLNAVTQKAISAIKDTHGTKFVGGPICKTIYEASGSSIDWAYEHGIKYPFAVELRDTGKYGFLLPARYIVPSGQEILKAVLAMALEIKSIEKL